MNQENPEDDPPEGEDNANQGEIEEDDLSGLSDDDDGSGRDDDHDAPAGFIPLASAVRLLGEADAISSESSSDGDDGAGNDESERVPAQGFDPDLPTRHTYLGETRQVSGRTILDEDKVVEIPIIYKTGIIMMPGQTVPLTFFQQNVVRLMKRLVNTTKTFGIVNRRYKSSLPGLLVENSAIGTTAEIFEVLDADDENLPGGYTVKTKGRQRFRVLSTRNTVDGILMADVKIVPEIVLPDPMYEIRLVSRDRLRPLLVAGGSPASKELRRIDDDGSESASTTNCIGVTSLSLSEVLNTIASPRASFRERTRLSRANKEEFLPKRPSHKFSRFNHLRTSVYGAPLTAFPNWVFEMYDAQILVERIHAVLCRLKLFSKTRVVVPEDPTELSFWVAYNLPLEESHRLLLLRTSCTIQRLRTELSLIEKCNVLCCRNCGETVGKQADIFCMSREGPQGAYVNSGGHVHETLTLYKVKRAYTMGSPEVKYSWFPGYAWEMLLCRNCDGHLGWRFTVDTSRTAKLHPNKFYGLTRKAIQPKLQLDEEEEEEED